MLQAAIGTEDQLAFRRPARRHSALDRRTPDAVYFGQVTCERTACEITEISLSPLLENRGPFLPAPIAGSAKIR